MHKISLHHFSSANIEKDAAKLVAEQIIAAINKYDKTLLLLSGGSAIKTYKQIFDFLPRSQDLSNLTVSLVDERYSAEINKNSNEEQLLESGVIEEFEIRAAKFQTWKLNKPATGNKLANIISEKYDELLKDHNYKIALLGLGEDGHTAGWLPTLNQEKFFQLYGKDEFVSYYKVDLFDSDNPHKQRLTSSIKTLKQFNKLIIYTKGRNKQKALEKLLAPSGEINQTPARILLEFSSELLIVTDQDFS